MSQVNDAQPSLSLALWASFKRELLIAARHKGELANPLMFFLMVVMFVPLGITPEKKVLATLAPGMIWVIALLATLLSLDGLFRSDYEDGSLEQMILSPQPLHFVVITKMLAHWLMTGVPLTLMAPILGVMLQLPENGYMALVVSLMIGTGVLSLIGSIGAALTVALRKGGLILSIIVMPLYVPVLIFGSNAVTSAILGDSIAANLAILAAMFISSLVLAPFAVAGALKIGADN